MWLKLNITVTYNQSSSIQFTQSCPTLCDPRNHSTPGLSVHHHFLEFTQTHVHQVGDAIRLSHPLSSPSLPASNSFQHQSLFQWVNSLHEVAKVLEFQLWHHSFQRTPRTDLLQNGLVGSPCRFNVIPIKLPRAFFTELKQTDIKSTWQVKVSRLF